jgi:hypothetical protein
MPSKYGKIPKRVEEQETPKAKLTPEGTAVVEVTSEVIAKGIPGHAYECPFSLAILKCVPGAYNCATTREGFRVFYGSKHGGYKFYPLNEVISGYIRDFDTHGSMKPFTYEFKP